MKRKLRVEVLLIVALMGSFLPACLGADGGISSGPLAEMLPGSSPPLIRRLPPALGKPIPEYPEGIVDITCYPPLMQYHWYSKVVLNEIVFYIEAFFDNRSLPNSGVSEAPLALRVFSLYDIDQKHLWFDSDGVVVDEGNMNYHHSPTSKLYPGGYTSLVQDLNGAVAWSDLYEMQLEAFVLWFSSHYGYCEPTLDQLENSS
jgi:hypothetical protein